MLCPVKTNVAVIMSVLH